MDNYTFNLDQKDIEEELSCVICLSLPTEAPLQCQGCDSIMCQECFKRLNNTRACPLRCQNPNYGKVKPKTMMLFDCLQIRCEKCSESVRSLQLSKHQETCGKSSDHFSGNVNSEPSTAPFDDYYAPTLHRESLQKSPAKPMKKKSQAPVISSRPMFAAPPLFTPLLSNNQSGEVNQRPPMPPRIHFLVTLIGILSLLVLFKVAHSGLKNIFWDNKAEFHWLCIGNYKYDGSTGVCFVALGQYSVGIIAIGQFGVGFITIAQMGIGLLFGLGQAIAGCGVTIGMITISSYVKAAMFGVGLYRVQRVLLGVHSLYSLLTREKFIVSPFIRNND